MIPGPHALDLARRILEHELGDPEAPGEIVQDVEGCFRRLQGTLVTLIGVAGFEALAGRAGRLARPEHGWLETAVVPARPDGIFEDLSGRVERQGASAVIDGATALLAHFIGLLFTFIGEELTLQIVQRFWTEVPRLGESRGSSTKGGE